MKRLTSLNTAKRAMCTVSLLGIATLAACDNRSTAPAVIDQSPSAHTIAVRTSRRRNTAPRTRRVPLA